MYDLSLWELIVIGVLVLCAVTPVIAYKKNRSAVLWFVLGLMFNPVALVVLLCLPARTRKPYSPPAAGGERRPIE
ncbi:MAG TPA: hypothetical protein VH249_12485 [Xanthobacteraceae bacterium]|jgi:hypothetical protein|nr:hypothetical protein [Xanthobacteraceae bacterium]